MIPASFQSRRVLALLNIPAVGFALAAVTAAIFGASSNNSGTWAIVTGIPTLLLGTLWAWVLRWPKTVAKSSFRWGWVASLPLAVLNSSLAAALLFSFDRPHVTAESFAIGAIAGATFGVIYWLPALILTLLGFGLPIAWSQKLAKKGLAGQERGEWIVGLVCALISAIGMAITFFPHRTASQMADVGVLMTHTFAVLGALTGGSAAVSALAREARRRRFVAEAEAGKMQGYRVDPTDEGKVLVRVVSQGKGYRVADFEEEIFELDAEGEATKPKHLEMAPGD